MGKHIEGLFKGRHFKREIILLGVRWYLRYKLSYRDLVDMMAERGLSLAYTPILRWFQRFVPAFENVGTVTERSIVMDRRWISG